MEFNRIYPVMDRLRLQMPLDSITMDILAAKSGISRATLYRIYGSRKELFNQYLHYNGETNAESLPPEVSERILKAAHTIFLSRGFASSTIESIAKEAGVGTATIYRHFESKQNLVEQVLTMIVPLENLDLSLLDDSENPQMALEEFTLSMLRWISPHQAILKLLLIESDGLTAVQKNLEKLRLRTRDKITNYFRDLLPRSSYLENQIQILTVTYLGLVVSFTFPDAFIDADPLQEKQIAVWISDIILQKIEEMAR